MCEYFDLVRVEKLENSFNIYLVEINRIPKEFESQKLESKAYFEQETPRDFRLRGKACLLKIKRRKWLNHDTEKIVYRNWNLVASGTRMTSEFATFLKETVK